MKDKVSKFINVFKKDGILKTTKKTYKYCMANYINKINFIRKIEFKINKQKILRNIQEILEYSDYERILVWRGSFGWNVPLYQRPQHIARCLSDKKCLIFYEVTRMTDKTRFIEKVKDNLFLINYEIKAFDTLLWQELEKINNPKYLQLYSTCWDVSEDTLNKYVNNGFTLLYEYIDDLNPLLAGTKELPENVKKIHKYVCENIDSALVVTSADNLYKDIMQKRKNKKNIILSTNGVEYKHFANNKNKEIKNLKYKKIIDEKKIIVGYYGALASWFDYELLKYIANKNKDINFVLIGIKYDNSFDESKIEEIENIHYLGKVDYKDLPNYANYFDICIIPFIINEITLSTNPIKVFEYMAMEKPIITTDMPECRKYKSVIIAKNKEEFDDKIKNINILYNSDMKKIEIEEAKQNSWEYKANEILELIKNKERLSK